MRMKLGRAEKGMKNGIEKDKPVAELKNGTHKYQLMQWYNILEEEQGEQPRKSCNRREGDEYIIVRRI